MEPKPRVEALRRAERDALLSRLTTLLKRESRVAAAWLHGSLGQGEGDAWSDLDLWVVVFDDAYSHKIRHAFASDALFTAEAPQNGPSGGSYLMGAHDAPTGPHLVDWYFQPLCFADVTEHVFLIEPSERTPSPGAPPPASIAVPKPLEWEPDAAEETANTAALFWAMLLIQAKHIARAPTEDGMGFEEFLLGLLARVGTGKGVVLEETKTPFLRNAAEKLNRLQRLGEQMAQTAPAFSKTQAAVARFLETVRQATEVP